MLPLLLLASQTASAADLASLCSWTDARWEQSAQLLLPGTHVAFASAWQGWKTTLKGTLGVDTTGVRFPVVISDPDLSVGGDIDPNEDMVFSLDVIDLPLGPSAVLVHGGRFTIAGAAPGGGVLVGPHRWAADDVWSPTAVGVVPCEQITVHWRASPDDATMLAAIGFPADAPEKVLPKGHSTRLYGSPDGALLGVIQKAKYWRLVRVSEERDGWSHVALTNWTGMVWHGWVESRRLEDPSENDGEGVLGGIMGGGQGEPIPVRRCNSDVALHAVVGRTDAEVGTVHAGAPFEVASEGDGRWTITFPGGWLSAIDKSALQVAADPALCPESTWTSPVGGDDAGLQVLP